MVSVVLLILVIVVVVVIVLNSPSHIIKTAEKKASDSLYDEAEALYRKVWLKSPDAPRLLADMFFSIAKKKKSATDKANAVKKALAISEDGLQDQAREGLRKSRKVVIDYTCEIANEAFQRKDYDSAVELIDALSGQGKSFTDKGIRFRAYKYGTELLKGANKKTVSSFLESYGDTARKYISEMGESLLVEKNFADSARILELVDDEHSNQLWSQAILGYVLKHKHLIKRDGRVSKRQLDFAENYADAINSAAQRETKLVLLNAVFNETQSLSVQEKIQNVLFDKAKESIAKDDYDTFKNLFQEMEAEADLEPAARKRLRGEYMMLQYCYLRDKVSSFYSPSAKWNDLEDSVKEYAASADLKGVLVLARSLTSQKRYKEASSICSLLPQDNSEVKRTIIKNIEEQILQSQGAEGIPSYYSKPILRKELFEALFADAVALTGDGRFPKALTLFKGLENDFTDAQAFYSEYATAAVSSLTLSTHVIRSGDISLVKSLLNKLEPGQRREDLIKKIEAKCDQLIKQKNHQDAYVISYACRDLSPVLSRYFLDSVYSLASSNKAPSADGLLDEIEKQDAPLEYLSRLHWHYPTTLRTAYVNCLGDKIEAIFNDNSQEAISILAKEENESVRIDILRRFADKNKPIFKEAVLDMLESKNRLPKQSDAIKEIVGMIALSTDEAFSLAALKDLTRSGYPAEEEFVKAVLKKTGRLKKNDSILTVIDDALEVTHHDDLVSVKKGIAQDLIESDPLTALYICEEIKNWCDVRDITALASLSAAKASTDLSAKYGFLKQAFGVVSKQTIRTKVEKDIVNLAGSYFSLGKEDQALAILKEFRCALTDKAYLEKQLDKAQTETGDSAAIKILSEAITYSDNSSFTGELGSVKTSLLEAYIQRVVSKSEKQPRDKAIASLDSFLVFLKDRKDVQLESQIIVRNRLHDLYMDEGREQEQSDHNKTAYECYAKAHECQGERDVIAISRKAVCSLKRKDIGIDTIAKDVDTVLPIAPTDIKKDIVYRYILRLLEAGHIKEASELAENNLRSPKIRALCESYKIRQVKSQIDDINKQLEDLNTGRMGFDAAKQFFASIDASIDAIAQTYPEHASLKSRYKSVIQKYILQAAFKEQKFDTAYDLLKKQKRDFLSDDTLFRNMAVACLGMMESGMLTRENYKEIIGVWLSAVYSDRLIVKSLDYTSWDDGYTFSLDDSLSQTYSYDDLPDNINLDEPSDSNIGIGQVQKSLLEKSDAILNAGDATYYAFYREQISAMDAMAKYQLENSISEDVICPCLFPFIPEKYRTHVCDNLDNSEDALEVGCQYGFTGGLFDKFRTAHDYYAQCVDALKRLVNVKTAFARTHISSISDFLGLYDQLIEDARNEFANHQNSGKSYKDLLSPFTVICKALNDSQLSFSFSTFINGEIIPKMNAKDIDSLPGLKVLFEVYKVYTGNSQLNDNIKAILDSVLTDFITSNDSESWDMIQTVVSHTNSFNSAMLDSIKENALIIYVTGGGNRANSVIDFIEQHDSSSYSSVTAARTAIKGAALQREMSDLIDKVNNKQISGSDALKENYKIYLKAKDDQRICQNLAILMGNCIMEYILDGKYGVSTVKSTLDQIYNNRSSRLRSQTAPFNERFDALWGHLNYENRIAVKTNSNLNDAGKRLVSTLEYLGKFGTRSIASASIF